MDNLPAGKYYVKEVKTAHGYVLDGEPDEVNDMKELWELQVTKLRRTCGF